MRFKATIVGLLLPGVMLLAPSPSWAALIAYEGANDSNNQATIDVMYVGTSTSGTLSLLLDNISPLFSPIITGLAFDTLAGADLTPILIPINWGFANSPGNVVTPEPVGVFDACAETGPTDNVCNGGIPNVGLGPNDGVFTFTFSVTGSGLSESAFFEAMNDFGESAVRFENTGPAGQGSDVAVPAAHQVPEPAPFVPLVSGALGLWSLSRRRERESSKWPQRPLMKADGANMSLNT